MKHMPSKTCTCILSTVLLLSGCTSTLVRDEVQPTAGVEGHCSGGKWADNSSIAVLPVSVVVFFVPHFDLNKIPGEPY